MAIKKVFKSYIPSMNYVTQKGRTCIFMEGRFLSDHPEEVAELTQMVNDKSNPHIYIDPDEQEVDTTLQDRIRAAQVEATQRVLAEAASEKDASKAGNSQTQGTQVKATTGGLVGGGMSAAQLLGVTNSANLVGISAQSNQKS